MLMLERKLMWWKEEAKCKVRPKNVRMEMFLGSTPLLWEKAMEKRKLLQLHHGEKNGRRRKAK